MNDQGIDLDRLPEIMAWWSPNEEGLSRVLADPKARGRFRAAPMLVDAWCKILRGEEEVLVGVLSKSAAIAMRLRFYRMRASAGRIEALRPFAQCLEWVSCRAEDKPLNVHPLLGGEAWYVTLVSECKEFGVPPVRMIQKGYALTAPEHVREGFATLGDKTAARAAVDEMIARAEREREWNRDLEERKGRLGLAEALDDAEAEGHFGAPARPAAPISHDRPIKLATIQARVTAGSRQEIADRYKEFQIGWELKHPEKPLAGLRQAGDRFWAIYRDGPADAAVLEITLSTPEGMT